MYMSENLRAALLSDTRSPRTMSTTGMLLTEMILTFLLDSLGTSGL